MMDEDKTSGVDDTAGVLAWKLKTQQLERSLRELHDAVKAEGVPAIEKAWEDSPARVEDLLGPNVRVGLVEHRPYGPGPAGTITVWLEQAAWRPWEKGPDGEDAVLHYGGTLAGEDNETVWNLGDPSSLRGPFRRPMSDGVGVVWLREFAKYGRTGCSWINTGLLREDEILHLPVRLQISSAIVLSGETDEVSARVYTAAIEWIDAGGEVFVHPGSEELS
jgi:hypothetical protein